MGDIDQPGVYEMSADEYHADPVAGGSLSSTGARKLLAPSCPAKFKHDLDFGQAPKAAFDFGHAAHKRVLGVGAEVIALDFDDWRTKDAKTAREEVREAGGVPLLAHEAEQVEEMAAALQRHPVAGPLFTPGRGVAEQVHVWVDRTWGIWRRSMVDWQIKGAAARLFAVDYKTCVSASPEAIQKAVMAYGYHQQCAWYLDGIKALGLHEDPGFIFVFQEKTAPYIVTVIQLDQLATEIGRQRNDLAIELYAQCRREGLWPQYSNEIELVRLPGWAEARHLQEMTP